MTWTEWPEYGPQPCVSLYQQDQWLQLLEAMTLVVQPVIAPSTTVGGPLSVTLVQRGMVAVNSNLITVGSFFDTLWLEDGSTTLQIMSMPYAAPSDYTIAPGELAVRFI